MDKWEIILSLFDYFPQVNRYKCKICGKSYKTENGTYKHIKENHQDKINSIRNQNIIKSLENK